MSGQGRRCDRCLRPIGGRPAIVASDNIFCSHGCKRRFPAVMRRRTITHYRQMAADASGWIAKTLEWQQAHPEEPPLDVEALRLVEHGAREIVAALHVWAPIPERALRLIHSAMAQQDADR
ncbi:MAG TPA: hypothetical protein VFI31_02790 [Pirellulales bacterium]|nr:hypothetical protein [Pirellulales bacterium]